MQTALSTLGLKHVGHSGIAIGSKTESQCSDVIAVYSYVSTLCKALVGVIHVYKEKYRAKNTSLWNTSPDWEQG